MLIIGVVIGNSTTSGAPCTVKTALVVRQVLISNIGFDPAYVKDAPGKQFFFVNGGKDPRTATAAADSPESFDVSVPKQRVAYEHTQGPGKVR